MQPTSSSDSPRIPGMALTMPEYLSEAEGHEWTPQNTQWVLTHVQQIERLAEDLIRRAKGRR